MPPPKAPPCITRLALVRHHTRGKSSIQYFTKTMYNQCSITSTQGASVRKTAHRIFQLYVLHKHDCVGKESVTECYNLKMFHQVYLVWYNIGKIGGRQWHDAGWCMINIILYGVHWCDIFGADLLVCVMVLNIWYGWCMVWMGGKGGRRPAQTNLPRTQVIPRPSSPLSTSSSSFSCLFCYTWPA